METKGIDRIGHIVNINNVEWRVAEKLWKFGREWQYILSYEKVDGTYDTMRVNERALEQIIKSGSKRIDIDE